MDRPLMCDPRHTVLVVEDEPVLRMAAVDMLEDAGFAVIEVADAAAAVAILEARDDVRLVFSDIDMPRGMDGMKLAAMIRDRWPPIEIVLTSGIAEPDASALPARCVFLPKPYRAEQVIDTLRDFSRQF